MKKGSRNCGRQWKYRAAGIAAALLLAAAGSGMTAAASEPAAVPSPDLLPDLQPQETVLTLLMPVQGENAETDPLCVWAETSFESFAEKEGVTLEIVPVQAEEDSEKWESLLQEKLAGEEELPDLVVFPSYFLEDAERRDLLCDLSAETAAYGEWSWYTEAAQDLAGAGSGVYGVPYAMRTAGLWYDKEALFEAGVIEQWEDGSYEEWRPSDAAEILEDFKALQKADKQRACLDFPDLLMYELLLQAEGGYMVTEEGTRIVESAPMDRVLEFIRESYAKGYAGDLEKGPVIRCGFTLPEGMERARTGFVRMPGQGDSGKHSLAEGMLLGIPAGAADRELAFSFLCHMMAPAQYLPYIQEVAARGEVCVRKDIPADMAGGNDPFYVEHLQLLSEAAVRRGTGEEETECILTLLQAVAEDPTDKGVKEAKEAFAESMREAVGAQNCWPRAEEEE